MMISFASPRHCKYISLAIFFAITYFLCGAYLMVNYHHTYCGTKAILGTDNWSDPTIRQRLAYDNDVVLEYSSLVKVQERSSSSHVDEVEWNLHRDCVNGSCKRVLGTGNLPLLLSRLKEETNSTAISNLLHEVRTYFLQRFKRRAIFSCVELDTFWNYSKLTNPRRIETIYEKESGIEAQVGKIVISPQKKSGMIWFKEAYKNDSRNGYKLLLDEYAKRNAMDYSYMPELPQYFGACERNGRIRVAEQYVQGPNLCDDNPLTENNFSSSSCGTLSKFKTLMMGKRQNKGRDALNFLRNFICLIANLRKHGIFLESLHGSNFIVRSDLSIVLKNLKEAVLYGANNLYGESICYLDKDCGSPRGWKWRNGSMNNYLYENCFDLKPLCNHNRCTGFNAAAHLCGITRWIIPAVLNFVESAKIRSFLENLQTKTGNTFAAVRISASKACSQMDNIVKEYSAISSSSKSAFHVGGAKKT